MTGETTTKSKVYFVVQVEERLTGWVTYDQGREWPGRYKDVTKARAQVRKYARDLKTHGGYTRNLRIVKETVTTEWEVL